MYRIISHSKPHVTSPPFLLIYRPQKETRRSAYPERFFPEVFECDSKKKATARFLRELASKDPQKVGGHNALEFGVRALQAIMFFVAYLLFVNLLTTYTGSGRCRRTTNRREPGQRDVPKGLASENPNNEGCGLLDQERISGMR